MNGSGVLTLIRQAYEALPDGTPQERTAWIQDKRRSMEGSPYPVAPDPLQRGPRAFSQVSEEDPKVRRYQQIWDGDTDDRDDRGHR